MEKMRKKLLGYSLIFIGLTVSGCTSAGLSGVGTILSVAGSAIPVPGLGAGLSAVSSIA